MKQDVQAHCDKAVMSFEKAAKKYPEIADRLREISREVQISVATSGAQLTDDFEALERKLSALDQEVYKLLRNASSPQTKSRIDREAEIELNSYRAKLSDKAFSMIEAQYLIKRLIEEFGLPRLSIFYMVSPDTSTDSTIH